MGWYVPPRIGECNEADFTDSTGALSEKKYKNCLAKENEKAKEIAAYEEVAVYCWSKYLFEEAEKAKLAETLAAAERGDAEMIAHLQQNNKPKPSPAKEPAKEDPIKPEAKGSASDYIPDKQKDAKCEKYGKIRELNYYDLGLFVGNMSAKVFATNIVS